MKDKGNGLYAFVLNGQFNVEGQELKNRDGLGIWNKDAVQFKATKDSRVLLMEVPMV